ncbi:ankyrin, partial [Athelia psychrophila]
MRMGRDDDERVSHMMARLFSVEGNALSHWVRLEDPDIMWWRRDHSNHSKASEDIAPPLYYACLYGLEEVVHQALMDGVDVEGRGGLFGSALQAASHMGHSTVVQLLLDHGADVNAQGGLYGNALEAASSMGHDAAVRLLLDRGAEVTPFRDAAARDNDPNAQASTRANVIVFGEAGAGKSSLVNLMAGRDFAEVSSGANGCTFESTGYDIDIPGGPAVRIWDTAGLEEGATGTVNTVEAISNIYKLTRNLEDGVSLLVYCVRGRITNSTIKNYKMFKGFCDGKVPIALVVTALEHERNKDAWWMKNAQRYLRAGVAVDDHACITTLKLSEWAEDYASSRTAMYVMLNRAYLRTPWKMDRKHWVKRYISKF